MERARVLIVGKDPSSVRNLEKVLLQQCYSIIGEAQDGLKALRQAREKSPDLVILEYELLYLIIEMALTNSKKVITLEQELEKLKSSLENRKRIEKAKGILMKESNISEPEAFKRLQKMSMDKRTSMEKIAEAIILTQGLGE